MRDAGLEIRKWASNSKNLMKEISKREGLEYSEESIMKKILGIPWNTSSDKFIMKFEKLIAQMKAMIITKRNILKVSASFYDPLGWIMPLVIRARAIFQAICSSYDSVI